MSDRKEDDSPITDEPGRKKRTEAGMGGPPGGGMMRKGGKRNGPVVWMPVPAAVANVNPALWYFCTLDQLIVIQLMEIGEIIAGFDQANKYVITNAMGQQIYYAFEMSNFLDMHFNANERAFTIHVINNAHAEVIRIHRPKVGYDSHLLVECPPGNLIGQIQEERHCCQDSKFHMVQNGQRVGFVNAPSYVSDIQQAFPLVNNQGQVIGQIQKHYGGFFKESYSNADTFGVKFPQSLAAEIKVLTLAVTFLIDFRYYEKEVGDAYSSNHY